MLRTAIASSTSYQNRGTGVQHTRHLARLRSTACPVTEQAVRHVCSQSDGSVTVVWAAVQGLRADGLSEALSAYAG